MNYDAEPHMFSIDGIYSLPGTADCKNPCVRHHVFFLLPHTERSLLFALAEHEREQYFCLLSLGVNLALHSAQSLPLIALCETRHDMLQNLFGFFLFFGEKSSPQCSQIFIDTLYHRCESKNAGTLDGNRTRDTYVFA